MMNYYEKKARTWGDYWLTYQGLDAVRNDRE